MRIVFLTVACMLAAGQASAQSIQAVPSSASGQGSITQLTCAHCPPAIKRKKQTYVVPQIAAGQDNVQLKEINGEMKLVRVEAFSGGSPVVFISKASDAMIKAAGLGTPEKQDISASISAKPPEDTAPANASVTVDALAKTGSLEAASMAPAAKAEGRSQEIDVQSFELRLN